MNKENNDTTLKQAQMNSDLQKYIAELEAATGRQATAADLEAARIAAEADKYASDRTLEGTKYKVDADKVSAKTLSQLAKLGYTVNDDGTVTSAADDKEREKGVVGTVRKLINLWGSNGINSWNDVRQAALDYYDGDYSDIIDGYIKQYMQYASKDKNGLSIKNNTTGGVDLSNVLGGSGK